MKSLTKKKLKKLSKKIVKNITEEVLAFFNSWESYGQFAQRMWGLPYRQKYLTKAQIYETVRRVRKQGWLEQKKVNDQIFYRLTKQGRIKLLLSTIKKRPFMKGEKATIIIFDIPEEKRTFRNFLRRLLKQIEFIMIQRSVFIAPYILPREFYLLLREMRLSSYVMIIEGQIRFDPEHHV